MKIKNLALFIFAFSWAGDLRAKNIGPVNNLRIEKFVSEYFKAQANTSFVNENRCQNRIGDCVDVVCQLLGPFQCDEPHEVNKALNMCRGNFDGQCIASACKYLGSFGCDDVHEIENIARACVGNFGGNCLNNICERLGTFSCDEAEEVIAVLKQCAGNKATGQ